jgi:hypothetical protein
MKEHVCAVNPMNIGDLIAGIHAAVTAVNASILERVQENTMQHTAVCLEMHSTCFKHLL